MLNKLKTICCSIIPIVVFVLLMHFFVYKFDNDTIIKFLIGAVILIIGQVIFLTGLDNCIVPMGEYVGNSLTNKKQFYIYVIFGFVFGIVSSIAEPDLQVFASKIVVAGFAIPKFAIMFSAGFGVGLLLALGLIRIVTGHSIRIMLAVCYVIVAILMIFSEELSIAISFDVGSSTTGVITSPFLLAFGISIAKICSHKQNNTEADSFGLVALSSVGPIIAILIVSIIFKGSTNSVVVSASTTPLWLSTLLDVCLSLIPLVVVFFIFEALFIKISKQAKIKLLLGALITFIGFYLFLFGVEFGFSRMGVEFGKALISFDNKFITIIICALLGFGLVFCEPSIRILANQIDEITNRNIKSLLVIVAIAISCMLSISLVLLKIYFSWPLWVIILIVYGFAFLLSIFTGNMFTAMAFDSSGVATGTLTVAFVFPIMIGVAGGEASGFGTLAILSMIPIVVMQLLGLSYTIMIKSEAQKTKRILLKLSRTEDAFSNIEALRKKHIKEFGGE